MNFFSLVAGKVIAESSGAGSGGGAALNIAYGDTPPTDKSKLWIKANEPKNIVFGSNFDGVEDIQPEGSLLSATYGIGCASVGTKIYLFGGYNTTNTINIYDTEAREITTIETDINFSYGIPCVNIGDKIYLFCQTSNSSFVGIFDTISNETTTLDITLPGNGFGCASVGNKIYLFGGNSNAIHMFDTETEQLIKLKSVSSDNFRDMACVAVGDYIYLFGGTEKGSAKNTIKIYDTKNNNLTTLADAVILGNYKCMACAAVGDKIYLFGGSYISSSVWRGINTIQIFDTKTNQLQESDKNLSSASWYISCGKVGTDIYLFGGATYSNGNLKNIDKFTVTHDLEENNIEVITSHKNFFNIVNTNSMKLEIGVDSVLIGNAENQATNCNAYLHNGTDWQQI